MMTIMKTNVKMMTMMMDENIATCGGAGLGECPLAVQTEAGIPSTIQIQPPLPSDKDDDNTNDDVLRMMITIRLMIVMLMVVVKTITMVMMRMVVIMIIQHTHLSLTHVAKTKASHIFLGKMNVTTLNNKDFAWRSELFGQH